MVAGGNCVVSRCPCLTGVWLLPCLLIAAFSRVRRRLAALVPVLIACWDHISKNTSLNTAAMKDVLGQIRSV